MIKILLNIKYDFLILVPVDGGWSDFGEWSKCSAECGGGKQERKKTCTAPAPANGGKDCVGEDSEERDCNTQACVGTFTLPII